MIEEPELRRALGRYALSAHRRSPAAVKTIMQQLAADALERFGGT